MTARRSGPASRPERSGPAGRSRRSLRRIGSIITDLALAAIFIGLWLIVLTRGGALSLWP